MKKIYKELYYTTIISFLITNNMFFGIFVWKPHDLSPNIALGVISLGFIIYTIFMFRLDRFRSSGKGINETKSAPGGKDEENE